MEYVWSFCKHYHVKRESAFYLFPYKTLNQSPSIQGPRAWGQNEAKFSFFNFAIIYHIPE